MRINIKPVGSLRIKDPLTKLPLKKEGESKPKNTYWNRRIKDGDVVVLDRPPKTSKETSKTEKSK